MKPENKILGKLLFAVIFLLGIFLLTLRSDAQNGALLPPTKTQLFDANGLPLAGGCVFSYQTGTTTPLSTYTDGTLGSPNANPVILDAAGRADIWLAAQKYRVVVKSAGGTACASGVTQSTTDNVSGNNLPLTSAISLTAQAAPTCNAGQYYLWSDSTALRLKMCNNGVIDSVVGLNTTDTLTNKTLTSPTINGGTATGLSNVTTQVENGIPKCDQYAGADASVKLNACIAAVIAAGGGTADARGLLGNQTISQTVNVGNSSFVPVSLLLPEYMVWNIAGIVDGTSCGFKLFGKSSIIGTATSSSSSSAITANGSVNADSMVCTDPAPSTSSSYYRIEGVMLYNPSGATFAHGLLNAQNLFDGSVFRNLTLANYATNGVSLRLYNACCAISFENIVANGNSTSGDVVSIEADGSHYNHAIKFDNLSAGHPGAGFAAVKISGGTAAPSDGVNRDINFFNLYTESGTGAGTFGLKISDARNINVSGWTAGVINGASFTGLYIAQTGANQVRSINIHGYLFETGAAGCVGINNTISSETIAASTLYFPNYSYGGSTGSQTAAPSEIVDNFWKWVSAAGVLTASIDAATGNVNATNYTVKGVSEIYTVASDFTLAANTNLQTITGLTWTLPANIALNVPFSCHLMYSQATAAVADQFGIQSATISPTNIAAEGKVFISASTLTVGTLPTLTTTTSTPIVTFTPSGITTVWAADLSGMIENPSNASANIVNILAQQSNAADLLTVKRGSYCKIF